MSEVGRMRKLYCSGAFTLSFKDQEMLKSFEEMVSQFNKAEQQILVEQVGENSYEVKKMKGYDECWELIWHKYISYLKDTTKSKAGENYEPVILTQLCLTPEET